MSTQGWTSSPNYRGTFDILWSCAQTTALCAWVSICVNKPVPNAGLFELLKDKIYFTLLTFLGPELVFLLAFTQFLSARTSVETFQDAGYCEWTLTHAFYADMGGISIKPRDWKEFPVNAKQIYYLISHKYMPYPEISLEDIKLRGRSDGLGRTITIAQGLYFTITTLARINQGLAITTLELTVLGFVICMLASSICWWWKPKDVKCGHVIEIETSIWEIIQDAGTVADGGYRDTPLDFVSSEQWSAQVLWNYYVNILRRLGIFPHTSKARPSQRISSFTFPKPPCPQAQLVILCLSLSYAAIFFCAWNFLFPSPEEQFLWRIFTVTQWTICAIISAFELFYTSWPKRTSWPKSEILPVNAQSSIHSPAMTTFQRIQHVWNKPFNNSINKDPYYDVPFRSILITTPLCAVYCICRWYLLLEDIIGLRSQPSSTYQTVDWTQFFPSF